MINIIVASNDTDQLEELQNGARQIAEQIVPRLQVDIRFASSVEQIAKKRNAETRLIIVAATLPQGRSSAGVDREAGLSFARSLATDRSSPPCILVSENEDYFKVVQSIRRCELLLVGSTTDYLEECVQLARRLGVIPDEEGTLRPQPAGGPIDDNGRGPPASIGNVATVFPKKRFALLEIQLPEDASLGIVHLELHEQPWTGKKVQERPLQLNQSALNEMIKESTKLKRNLSKWQREPERFRQHYEQWHRNYRNLGTRVDLLLSGSRSFTELYNAGKGWADGNIRVRFNLEEPWFEGLWEAMPAEQDGRHLILDNPVARRAIARNRMEETGCSTPSIEPDDGVLNILVVQSDVRHDSEPKGPDDLLWRRYLESQKPRLPRLLHLADEVKVIRDLAQFRPGDKAGRIEVRVEVLNKPDGLPADALWSLADDMESELKNGSRRYDIVHFAGHALFDRGPVKEDARGYLVFSGFPKDEAVPIARVASWLKDSGVQLVYLSCCRSSAASAALELARNDVPMAIGFHWDLDDAKAPLFAKHFYQELLCAKLKVCPAISKARSKLFDSLHKGDPIWASPVLIAQPYDWAAVEGVLKMAGRQQQAQAVGRG